MIQPIPAAPTPHNNTWYVMLRDCEHDVTHFFNVTNQDMWDSVGKTQTLHNDLTVTAISTLDAPVVHLPSNPAGEGIAPMD